MIKGFLQETTLPCQTFGSGREFLAAYEEGQPGCLVLETLIPDMSGLQIHRRLAAGKSLLPLIFVASRMDVSTAVELMREGVVHVLEKPVARWTCTARFTRQSRWTQSAPPAWRAAEDAVAWRA